MKTKRILSFVAAGICALAACFCAGLGIFATFYGPDAQPVMLVQPQQAYDRAEGFLSALEAGDLQLAGTFLLGQPSLGADHAAQDAPTQVIWDGFVESFSCQIPGTCYPSNSGVSLDLIITALDLDSTTASIGSRTEALIQERLDNAQSMEELYDAYGNYSQELLQEVLTQAARDALAQDGTTVTHNVTLSLVYREGQWWILPQADLMEAISYGLLS